MATIEDLKIHSITDMTPDEAIEYLRQLRLSRRIPVKKKATTTKKKSNAIPKMSKTQAADLLKLLSK